MWYVILAVMYSSRSLDATATGISACMSWSASRRQFYNFSSQSTTSLSTMGLDGILASSDVATGAAGDWKTDVEQRCVIGGSRMLQGGEMRRYLSCGKLVYAWVFGSVFCMQAVYRRLSNKMKWLALQMWQHTVNGLEAMVSFAGGVASGLLDLRLQFLVLV